MNGISDPQPGSILRNILKCVVLPTYRALHRLYGEGERTRTGRATVGRPVL